MNAGINFASPKAQELLNYRLYKAIRTAIEAVIPVLGEGAILVEIGFEAFEMAEDIVDTIESVYGLFASLPSLIDMFQELASAPEKLLKFKLKCISDEECARLAEKMGNLIGNLAIDTPDASEKLDALVDNLLNFKDYEEYAKYIQDASRKTGLEQFIRVRESISKRAAAYQSRITGKPSDIVYIVRGVKFDGFDEATSVLLDAKGPGYANFVKNGPFLPWWDGTTKFLKQAEQQISVADGTKNQWHFAE